MISKTETHFFLGANSKNGFYSLYDEFTNIENGDFFWLIKGGPGCGKSSFMKHIAKKMTEEGFAVSYIHCSGDPDSLDGIYIPEKKVGYVDATSPHVCEAKIPAACDSYLNLGSLYKNSKLRDKNEELLELSKKYKRYYTYIYSLLSAAGKSDPSLIPSLITEQEKSQVIKRAISLASREFGRPSKSGLTEQKHRFISAISCKGRVRVLQSVSALCSRVYAIDDDLGLADVYLKTVAEEASLRNIGTVLCHDPLHPEKIEAILMPEISLALIAMKQGFEEYIQPSKNIRLDAVVEKSKIQENRSKIRTISKLRESLIDEAISQLAEAKVLHDEIEAVYNPYVDFDGLYTLADKHIKMILSK